MEPSASVAADLLTLSDALDEPGDDLGPLLQNLGASYALAVTSCLGFSLTLVVDGVAFSVTLFEPPLDHRHIVTSVTIPLSSLVSINADSEITFYAGNRGGLVDLAADLSHALGLRPDIVQFDKHLTPGTPGTSRMGLDHAKSHNQALGILLGQGYGLDEARAELDRRARQAQTTSEVAARRLIDATIRPPNLEPM